MEREKNTQRYHPQTLLAIPDHRARTESSPSSHHCTMLSYLVAAAAALALPSLAAINPTSPDSSTVVKVGDDITALWTADTTGQWTNLEIQLMTGPNLDMVPLSVLGQGIDGTTKTSFSAPAPAVSPYSQIYFLQFTQGGNVSTALWSTRFTIAGPDGSTTPPTNTTTWNGQAVQWGEIWSHDGAISPLIFPPSRHWRPHWRLLLFQLDKWIRYRRRDLYRDGPRYVDRSLYFHHFYRSSH
ncbi:hypothetical protein BD324DRAFT_222669 [Kockovaella imperatae]|uniref:Yeast cell wall synthesis Kre9/Knh1-like N-terminal domain-containing protein n=1 Tax=Kockovaella imperatae TaxID=4999 RepID=A0A1Y1UNL4_9TREE|nr:hypothetical protein BD324DRAFT_222669 [Kockovaella imperatae]ORX39609.1 hypothetical protein BD324DRAFT_222669 [Kockovaella imperatae]